MEICDRCRKNTPRYRYYVYQHQAVLCDKCERELDKMRIMFGEMEKEFMKNKTLKHIHVDWS